ncbi:MAG: NADH-quinone oxidoreductase subunit J [Deltaproteobacteria bacterium]|nr:NADH-quinone oxidoreductase subunit J [Deltaproteobacteria bacterium]
MEAFLFYIFAIVTAGLSLLVILQPNAVGAAMSLVGAFFGIAALFVLMQAHFVAVMQILLYAGAIMVFFIFVVMMLNLEPKQLRWRTITGSRLIGGSAAIYLLGLLLVALLERRPVGAGASAVWGGEPVEGTVEAVGELLLSQYIVPFEVTSITLLVAIIGAVTMGKREL